MSDKELRQEIDDYLDELTFLDFGNGAFGMLHPEVIEDLKGLPDD